jgi:methyl-accepting chemotaxis protein
MRIKVFLITLAGTLSILVISALLIFTQMKAVDNMNLSTLTESLYHEDTKILSWILGTVPLDRLENLKLPESWAEISVVNNSDLTIVSSTNPGRKGSPLHSHPELLDQGNKIIESMKGGKPSMIETKAYMVVVQPVQGNQSVISLKPKKWEKGIVEKQAAQLEKDSTQIMLTLLIFLGAGFIVSLIVSLLVAGMVGKPLRKLKTAFEALSLGDFTHELEEGKGSEMKSISESYLRLKTSLALALERLGRR